MTKTAFLFPGQGAQYLGMGRALYEKSLNTRRLFEEASEVLGLDMKKLCLESDREVLKRTSNAQPAILLLSFAFYEHLKLQLPSPQFMAGHSLGEYSALTCSGVLNFRDALEIIKVRGRLMDQALEQGEGIMSAINKLDSNVIESLCAENSNPNNIATVASYNSGTQTVISGHKNAVQRVEKKCVKYGGEVVRLKVSAAFHSPVMKNAAEELKKELIKYPLNLFNCEVISNLTGKVYTSSEEVVDGLTHQMTNPIQWSPSIEFLKNSGVGYFIEIGPGKVLRNLLSGVGSMNKFSVDSEGDLDKLREVIKKDIRNIETVVTKSLNISATSINRNWNIEEYKEGVLNSQRELKKMQERLEFMGELPSYKDSEMAVHYLSKILDTKKMSQKEKLEKLKYLSF